MYNKANLIFLHICNQHICNHICKSFISQHLRIECPLGGKFDFFSPSGFEIQSVFDYRTLKIKSYSVRALKCYLNEKNLIHGRVTATISKLSPQKRTLAETRTDTSAIANVHQSHL